MALLFCIGSQLSCLFRFDLVLFVCFVLFFSSVMDVRTLS